MHGPYKVLPSRNMMRLEKLEEPSAKDEIYWITWTKGGPFAIFWVNWIKALKLGSVRGLLCALIPFLPAVDISFLCSPLHACFWPSSIPLAKPLCILLGVCSLISPAVNHIPASNAQYLWISSSPQSFSHCWLSSSTVQFFFSSSRLHH